MASRIGNDQDAYDYFKQGVLIDLENLGKNSDHGLHMAAMASAWMAVV